MRASADHRVWGRGFLLMEVLVALAILAVGITGLLVALNNSLDFAKRSKMYSTAMFLANDIMIREERLYAFSDEVATSNSGTFYDEGLPEFTWETDTQLDSDRMQYVITVTIRWEYKRSPLSYRIVQAVPSHRETIEQMRKRKRK